MIKYDKEYFKEKFPNLFKSIENKKTVIEMDGVRTDPKKAKEASEPKKPSRSSVIDYIRLCDEEKEAFKIIDYMEKEGKIEEKYSKKLREQLSEEGLRSFGTKRDPGEYPFTEENPE